jgi:hypothetical protein
VDKKNPVFQPEDSATVMFRKLLPPEKILGVPKAYHPFLQNTFNTFRYLQKKIAFQELYGSRGSSLLKKYILMTLQVLDSSVHSSLDRCKSICSDLG